MGVWSLALIGNASRQTFWEERGSRSEAFSMRSRSRSESAAKNDGRTLIATSRPSRESRARYTSPMPPEPQQRLDLIVAQLRPRRERRPQRGGEFQETGAHAIAGDKQGFDFLAQGRI
jgi:hypothetical protein